MKNTSLVLLLCLISQQAFAQEQRIRDLSLPPEDSFNQPDTQPHVQPLLSAPGYAVPPDEMPFAKCDTVGNPADDSLSATQRTPLALANLIASVRSATHGALQVQVSTGEPENLRTPYPTVAGDLTAGDWNRSGSANNRVEIRIP